jgi:hypothetical protein
MEWLNLRDYTVPQLALYATGAYLWVLAYAIYIRNGFKFGVVEMPAFAACSNLGWQLNWAVFFTTDLGLLSVWAHKAWFLLDVVVFYLVLRFAHKQTDVPLLKRYWIPLCLALFIAAAAFYGSFVREGLDLGSTIESAYLCQLLVSFLYIPLMLSQKSLIGWSMWTASTRTLGTALIGAFAFMRYPGHAFLLTMAVIATVVDCFYIALFTVRKRALA